MKFKVLGRKIVAIMAMISMVFQFTLIGPVMAAETDVTITPITVDEPAVVPTTEPLIIDEPTPTPTPTPTSTVEVPIIIEPTPTPISTVEVPIVVDPIIESTPTPTPTPTPTEIIPEPILTPIEPEIILPTWVIDGNSATTGDLVKLNETYVAPQNNHVKVKFTKLPEIAGNLTIKEIKLSPNEQKISGSASSTVYDITSNMDDGTFIYDLTLPIPANVQNKDIVVKSSENVSDLKNAQIVTEAISQKVDTIKVVGLNHFTVFVIAENTGNMGTFMDWNYTDCVQGLISGNSYLEMTKDTSVLTSPTLDFSTTTSQSLSFKARTFGGVTGDSSVITASVSTNGDTGWTVLGTRTPSSTDLMSQESFDLSAYTGQAVKIKLETLSAVSGNGVGVDDIAIVGDDVAAPTATVAHNETAKTITYSFNEPVQLRDSAGTVLTSDTYAASLAIYEKDAYLSHQLYQPEPAHIGNIESAILSADGQTLVITYSGSLIKQADTSYIVDAWGKNITDLAGNKLAQAESQIFTVTGDSTLPVITIEGQSSDPLIVSQGAGFTHPNASAWDNIDGDLGQVFGSEIDTAVLGETASIYTATDKAGNTGTASRAVNIVAVGPTLSNVAFTQKVAGGSLIPLVKVSTGYYIKTSGDATAPDHLVQFAADSTSDKLFSLENPIVGLYLQPTNEAQTTELQAYYSANSVEPYLSYLNAAAAGTKPFANIRVNEFNKVRLVDGAQYAIHNWLNDMVIPDDCPNGEYTVQGTAADRYGNTTVLTFTLIVDHTAPVITLSGLNPYPVEVGSTYEDPGYSATDNYDTTVSVNMDTTGLNMGTLGTYTIYYSATDSSGNHADQKTRTVIVEDTTKPVITLTGDVVVTVEALSSYIEQGAPWTDNVDGSGSAVISGDTVDTNHVGTYTVRYNYTDTATNSAMEVTRIVNVIDTTKPIITLVGTSIVNIEVYSSYSDAGATASDTYDGNISGGIAIVNSVNIDQLGSYNVTYNVSDLAGNHADEVVRTVNVVDTTNPVITLTGDEIINIVKDSTYTDAGATATDNVDGDISFNIEQGGSVDTAEVGQHTMTYDVSDAAGNEANQVSRTVNVIVNMVFGLPTETTVYSDIVDVQIPGGITVTSADPLWNGVVAAPTVTTVDLPVIKNYTRTLISAIEIGFADAKLSFDKGVRLSFTGRAGKRVGYTRPGTAFTEITTICGEDSQTWADHNLGIDGDCKIDNVDGDLVVWTKHFTTFAVYTQTRNISSKKSHHLLALDSTVVAQVGSSIGSLVSTNLRSTSTNQTVTPVTGDVISVTEPAKNDEVTSPGVEKDILGAEQDNTQKSKNNNLIWYILGGLIVIGAGLYIWRTNRKTE